MFLPWLSLGRILREGEFLQGKWPGHTFHTAYLVCIMDSMLYRASDQPAWTPRAKPQQNKASASGLYIVSTHISLSIASRILHNIKHAVSCVWVRFIFTYLCVWDFWGGARDKEHDCQCRWHKRGRFSPWVGKILWRRVCQPTPVSLPGESHGQRSLVRYSL